MGHLPLVTDVSARHVPLAEESSGIERTGQCRVNACRTTEGDSDELFVQHRGMRLLGRLYQRQMANWYGVDLPVEMGTEEDAAKRDRHHSRDSTRTLAKLLYIYRYLAPAGWDPVMAAR